MRHPVTFSTLACPQWSVNTVIARAAEFGYAGLEWRGGPQGHLQPAASASDRAALRRATASAGLFALAVTAYTSFASENAAERQSNLDELRRYVDLAADIGAAYVRTFLGELPPGSTPTDKLYEAMAGCLEVAATHAQAVGVTIAIEPHDDFVLSDTIVPILRRGLPPALGVIWDLGNTFAAGEDPETGFGLLGNHLAYVQVKDGHGRGSQWQLRPLGQGEVPLERAFNLLLSSPYTGAFSVEWEWAWHPELDPPEVALPRALHQVRALLAAAQPATT